MARETAQPEILRELWQALDNNQLLVAECLARPLLAHRLALESYRRSGWEQGSYDERSMNVQGLMESDVPALTADYHLPMISTSAARWSGHLREPSSDTPQARFGHAAVWTGSEMIVWCGRSRSTSGTDITLGDGKRYYPSNNKWLGMR